MLGQAQAPRILIIEDERDVASLIKAVLQDEGYDVSIHPNGDCLDVIRTLDPDVILCDYQLPYCNGATLLRRLRSNNICSARFVMISAIGRAQVEWRNWGADDFLAKPFDIERLISVVERALSHDATVWSRLSDETAGEQAS